MLFVNADDWGRTQQITDRILTCFFENRIHETSAMTFMADSERSAELAQENQLPTGLHLNLDEELSGKSIPTKLLTHHNAVSVYLKKWKWNQVIFNPFLCRSFDYVFQSQWDEFGRLYGEAPKRLDGHHHLHLSMNMLLSGEIPKGIKVRRNFTFRPGEKNIINLLYRYFTDLFLTSSYLCTDYFFSIAPINIQKISHIVAISKSNDVELMTHPGEEAEYDFLLSPAWETLITCNL
jgi:predicted glycoside hydrolase/deacetylase ChbG (UPF0249 family)